MTEYIDSDADSGAYATPSDLAHDPHCDCPDLTAGGICPEARGRNEDSAIAAYAGPVCATPGCGTPSRWIAIPEGNQLGSSAPYRCSDCCDATPWTHAYADPSDGEWRVACPDCHAGGVSGVFTRDDAIQRVADHRAWHLADALCLRQHGI